MTHIHIFNQKATTHFQFHFGNFKSHWEWWQEMAIVLWDPILRKDWLILSFWFKIFFNTTLFLRCVFWTLIIYIISVINLRKWIKRLMRILECCLWIVSAIAMNLARGSCMIFQARTNSKAFYTVISWASFIKRKLIRSPAGILSASIYLWSHVHLLTW